MSRIRFNHCSFSTGIINKSVEGNSEFEGYNNSLHECENFHVQNTGGLFKRSGTRYVDDIAHFETRDTVTFVMFELSANESMLLEIGMLPKTHPEYNELLENKDDRKTSYIRAFTTKGAKLGADGNPLHLLCNFTEIDLEKLQTFQNGNILYFLCDDRVASFERTEKTRDMEMFMFTPRLTFTVLPLTFMNSFPVKLSCKNAGSTPGGKIGEKGNDIIVRMVDANDNSKSPRKIFAPGFYESDEIQIAHSVDGTIDDQMKHVALTYLLAGTASDRFDTTEPIFYLKIKRIEPDPDSPLVPDPNNPEGPMIRLFNRAICVIDKGLSPTIGASGDSYLPIEGQHEILLWRISSFTKDRGFPRTFCPFEGRLFFANAGSLLGGIWGSSIFFDDWFNFSVDNTAGSALQSKTSVSAEIYWLAAHSKLFLGSSKGLFVVGGASFNQNAITQKNFGVPLFDSTRPSPIIPVMGPYSVFFIGASERSVHEIIFTDNAVFKVNNLTLLCDSIFNSPIVEHAWQGDPDKIYWTLLSNGELRALTYLKNNNIVAWTKHSLSSAEEGHAHVRNICSTREISGEILWVLVDRLIGGKRRFTIEYMLPNFSEHTRDDEHCMVDCSLNYSLRYPILNVKLSTRGKYFLDGNQPFELGDFEKVLLAPRARNLISMEFFDSENFEFALFDKSSQSWEKIHPSTNALCQCKEEKVILAQDSCVLFVAAGEVLSIVPDYKHLCIRELHERLNSKHDNTYYVFRDTGIEAVCNGEVFQLDDVNEGYLIDCINPVLGYYELYSMTRGAHVGFSEGQVPLIRNARVYVINGFCGLSTGDHARFVINGINKDNFLPDEDIMLENRIVTRMLKLNNIGPELSGKKYRTHKAYEEGENLEFTLFDPKKGDGVPLSIYSYKDIHIADSYVMLGIRAVRADLFSGSEVSVVADGKYVGKSHVSMHKDNIIALNETAYNINIGYAVNGAFEVVPFSGMTGLGTTDGAIGNQKSAIFTLWRSFGGYYGHNLNSKHYAIPYRSLEREDTLATEVVKVPMGGALDSQLYSKTLSVIHSSPTPFNVLNIIREIDFSDS